MSLHRTLLASAIVLVLVGTGCTSRQTAPPVAVTKSTPVTGQPAISTEPTARVEPKPNDLSTAIQAAVTGTWGSDLESVRVSLIRVVNDEPDPDTGWSSHTTWQYIGHYRLKGIKTAALIHLTEVDDPVSELKDDLCGAYFGDPHRLTVEQVHSILRQYAKITSVPLGSLENLSASNESVAEVPDSTSVVGTSVGDYNAQNVWIAYGYRLDTLTGDVALDSEMVELAFFVNPSTQRVKLISARTGEDWY